MTKEIIYKLQGDGRESWICIEKDNTGAIINKYMIYEDPTIHPLLKMFKELSKEQKDQIKAILNKTT